MDLTAFPYPSRRIPTVTRQGMVATTQPLAVRAGLAVLERGGNAVDAAIAAATTLTVVEPTSNGIGGDAFALVWDGEHLHGLNGSGRAPALLTPDLVQAAGFEKEMPSKGWLTVTVPGAPRAWSDLHRRFGHLPFEQVLEPAIHAAEKGYAVTPVIATNWAKAASLFTSLEGNEFRPWRDIFTINDRAPRVGEIWRSTEMAQTLRRIAESESDDFYEGQLARRIAAFAAETGGPLSNEDLASHSSTWINPISTSYRDHEVWEIPPNGQGLTALIALNILEGFEIAKLPRESVEAYHLQIEAMKLAFADARRFIADPEQAAVPTEELLYKEYAADRRALITDQALEPAPGSPLGQGTVYLCTADADGMMVSFIQSNYAGFGSGIVVPGTGIALQNRGSNFSLDPFHPNILAPRKRPYHTIIPGFLTRQGSAIGPFGVMGGFMQPQGHVQVVLNTVDWNMNPQSALDAPRWQVQTGKKVLLEHGVPFNIAEGLIARGHEVTVSAQLGRFGRGQIIRRLASGAYAAGSEPRADGLALGY